MRYGAMKPGILLSKEPAMSHEGLPSRLQEIGDRICCAGLIVAGLLGYVFVWFVISSVR